MLAMRGVVYGPAGGSLALSEAVGLLRMLALAGSEPTMKRSPQGRV